MAEVNHFQTVFWIAVIPTFLSLGVGVHEPDRLKDLRRVRMPLRRNEIRRLGASYWRVVAIATAFTLAHFSEVFAILRVQSTGLPRALVPTVFVIMNLVYALSTYPVDLFLPFATDIVGAGIGAVLWGLHMDFTQGLLAPLVAEAAPAELHGTVFGVFNLMTGSTLLAASVLPGAAPDPITLRPNDQKLCCSPTP